MLLRFEEKTRFCGFFNARTTVSIGPRNWQRYTVASIALANTLDPRPEQRQVYHRAGPILVSHDAKGLTDLDFRLASAMDPISVFVAQ